MLAFPPSYALPMAVILFAGIPLFFYKPVRTWLKPERLVVIAIIPVFVLFPVFVINFQQAPAYDVGTVRFYGQSWNFTITPQEVKRIDDVSNIHTKASIYLQISSEQNVTFYIVDQNRPDVHYMVINYTEGSVGFHLPYLLTEQDTPARWSVCFMNPNYVLIDVEVQSFWLEDSIELAEWSISYNLYFPLVALMGFWVSLGTPVLFIHRRDMRSPEFLSGVALVILGVSIGMIASYAAFFLTVVPALFVYLAVLPAFFCREEKKTGTMETEHQEPSVDII